MSSPIRPPARSLELTQITEWDDGKLRACADSLAAEEPLQISIDQTPLTVTMRTPGDDLDLTAGFLLTEGIIESSQEIQMIQGVTLPEGQKSNEVRVNLGEGRRDTEGQNRNFFASSGCGVCGKATINAIRLRGLRPPNRNLQVDPEILCSMPATLRESQAVFARTGGLHAAALFDQDGRVLVVREDIGRHNAVDKVIGWAVRRGQIPLDKHILLVSGRGGFEIVQKALAAGIPIIASVSAPSSLAVRLARELGLTLIGFLRGRRFVVYSGEFRCVPSRATGSTVSAP